MKMRCLYLLCLAAMLEQPAVAAEKLISPEELKVHNTAADCWISVNDSIYDISRFIKEHEDKCKEMKLIDACGSDATELWLKKEKAAKPHKRKSVMAFESSKIGKLSPKK